MSDPETTEACIQELLATMLQHYDLHHDQLYTRNPASVHVTILEHEIPYIKECHRALGEEGLNHIQMLNLYHRVQRINAAIQELEDQGNG